MDENNENEKVLEQAEEQFVYWDNGFYLSQNEQGTRTQITKERREELLNLSSKGYDLYTDENGYPQAREHIADPKAVAEYQAHLKTRTLESTDYIGLKLAEACSEYLVAKVAYENSTDSNRTINKISLAEAEQKLIALNQKYQSALIDRQALRDEINKLNS